MMGGMRGELKNEGRDRVQYLVGFFPLLKQAAIGGIEGLDLCFSFQFSERAHQSI